MLSPPSTIGILGSGQLGRMLALVALERGYRVHVFGPGTNSPAGQVAHAEWNHPYDDLDAVEAFARSVDVVTYEFENVPLETAATAARFAPLRPGLESLRITQNRILEKQFLRDLELPMAPFWSIERESDFAPADFESPAVLKTARAGYDGKGQVVIHRVDDALSAWQTLDQVPAVLERWIDLDKELSVIIGRDQAGKTASFGPIENSHVNHILDTSVCPAVVADDLAAAAVAITQKIAVALDLIGVICVEFFVTTAGRLLVNEIAPRPHNSGHLTIEGHQTSQFEQQLRTICGWPVGLTTPRQPTAMANILGDLWADGPPAWAAVSPDSTVKIHLYGKAAARPGRKMGHLTAGAATAADALNLVKNGRKRLISQAAAQGEILQNHL